MKKVLLLITSIFLLANCGNSAKNILNTVFNFPKKLKEISGLVYTSENEFYVVEDSNNENAIYVLNHKGKIKRTLTIQNINNNDWEDLTIDNKGNLYIGDFGNNKNQRKNFSIYKIANNNLHNTSIKASSITEFDFPELENNKKLLFDAEGFFEYQNYFYIFTKNRSQNFDGTSYIYKIPNQAGFHQAQLIGKIKTCNDRINCAITSATISPDGKKIVLLSHNKIWLIENFSSDKFDNGTLTEYKLHHNSQKESVTFKDNDLLYIADERVKKSGGKLYEVSLKAIQKENE